MERLGKTILFLVFFIATANLAQQQTAPSLEEAREKVGAGKCYKEDGFVYAIGMSSDQNKRIATDRASMNAQVAIAGFFMEQQSRVANSNRGNVVSVTLTGFQTVERYFELKDGEFRVEILMRARISRQKMEVR